MIALLLSLLLLLATVKSLHQNFESAFTFFPSIQLNCDLLFSIANINIHVYSMSQTYIWVRTDRTDSQTGEENIIYALVQGKKKARKY